MRTISAISDNGSQWSKEVRIKLGPIDSNEGTWSGVPQECKGLAEECESCSRIRKCDDTDNNCEERIGLDINAGPAYNKDECDEWKDGDGERGDTPERLLEIRRGGKVPSRTMNATENGGKDRKEEGWPETVISMF